METPTPVQPQIKTISKEALRVRRNIAISIFLMILLIALIVIYYLMTRPPRSVDAPTTKGYSHIMSIYGYRNVHLGKPNEVAVAKNGDIYILDSENHRVVIFDEKGNYVGKFGKRTGEGAIPWPTDIAIDSKGIVFVALKDEDKIVMFKGKDHEPFWEINVPGPQAMAVDGNRLYVATETGIMIGTTKGKILNAFGGFGREKGLFDLPTGIAVRDGNIYVADSGNYRLQALNESGEVIWVKGKPIESGTGPRNLERDFGTPAGLTIDEDGNLYLVDGLTGEIIVYNEKGRRITKVGEWGHDDGLFYYPDGIAYAGNSRLVIADKLNDRVQVIRLALRETPISLLLNLLSPIVLIILLTASSAVLLWRWYSMRPVAAPQKLSHADLENI